MRNKSMVSSARRLVYSRRIIDGVLKEEIY